MKKMNSKRVGMGPLQDSSGELITNDDRMAELLIDFFCSVFHHEQLAKVLGRIEQACR